MKIVLFNLIRGLKISKFNFCSDFFLQAHTFFRFAVIIIISHHTVPL